MRYLLMGIDMDSKTKINSSDYEFFKKLPNSEKLMFLYDLACTEYYQQDTPQINMIEHWHKLVASSLMNDLDANVLIIDKIIVVNSNSYSFLQETIRDMFMLGYILKSLPVTGISKYVFHQQKFCKIYYLSGVGEKIWLN